MRLNWIGYNYRPRDGYGRYSLYMIRALRDAGHEVCPLLAPQCDAPAWLHQQWGIDWSAPTVSCLPPFGLHMTPGPGPHWLYTMTEGSALPGETEKYRAWADIINESNVSRVIVPCAQNAEVFRSGGVAAPVNVIHGGTDPGDFPLLPTRPAGRPYTFLAFADRGARKGWVEVWAAFYRAFGSPRETPDVRLIIKSLRDGNDMLDLIAGADNLDPRLSIIMDDFDDIADFYALGDCLAIPSRGEGWGMIMREGAISGLPVITQAYSGMDDGHTDFWALVVKGGALEPIPARFEHIAGEWRKADVQELADLMRSCYACPEEAAEFGEHAAAWIRDNQTWAQTAASLVALLESEA